MNNTSLNLGFVEQVTFSLRSLYNRRGYAQYKMNKFEEYDLYARNKDFLISDNVITFTDLNGKLMALKPDVTLSIVKNSTDNPQGLQKLYYNENVYRVSKGAKSFREILQVGLECLGNVDDFCIAEVMELAAESLLTVSPDSILEISHLGLLSSLMDRFGVQKSQTGTLLRYISEKNLHELTAACLEAGVSSENIQILTQLVSLNGPVAEVLPQVLTLLRGRVDDIILGQFERVLSSLMGSRIASALSIDFSVVDDIHYYNGFVFKGFISGLPSSVLSGGQYDKLMKKMGRRSKAIGFAVYMDLIERLEPPRAEYDVDSVLLYDENTDMIALRKQAETLRQDGSVLVQQQIPTELRFRRLFKFQGSEVISLEDNT